MNEPVTAQSTKIYPTDFYYSGIPEVINLTHVSRGKILVNPKKPEGPVLIYPNYFDDPKDIFALLAGAKTLYISLEKQILSEIKCLHLCLPVDTHPWGSDAYIVSLIRNYTFSISHPVGTCRMGPQWDVKAVVDPRLRVYGISGPRVIDASIMPLIVRGTAHAASMMIGEKGAKLIYEHRLIDEQYFTVY